MKLKLDFITNSSSASFILYIDSTATDLSEFESQWKNYIDAFIHDYYYRLEPKIKKYRKILIDNYEKDKKLEQKVKDGTATEDEISWFNVFVSKEDLRNPNEVSDDEIKKRVLGQMMIEKIAGSTYSVEHFTPMFNNICDDVPNWMIELIVMYNMNPTDLLKYGFKDVKLKISQDN